MAIEEVFKIRVSLPRYKARLIITPEFEIHSAKYPNAWRRFWYWALLGWRWARMRS